MQKVSFAVKLLAKLCRPNRVANTKVEAIQRAADIARLGIHFAMSWFVEAGMKKAIFLVLVSAAQFGCGKLALDKTTETDPLASEAKTNNSSSDGGGIQTNPTEVADTATCGDLPLSRTMYFAKTTPLGRECVSEVQKRACIRDGVVGDWSGTFTESSCKTLVQSDVVRIDQVSSMALDQQEIGETISIGRYVLFAADSERMENEKLFAFDRNSKKTSQLSDLRSGRSDQIRNLMSRRDGIYFMGLMKNSLSERTAIYRIRTNEKGELGQPEHLVEAYDGAPQSGSMVMVAQKIYYISQKGNRPAELMRLNIEADGSVKTDRLTHAEITTDNKQYTKPSEDGSYVKKLFAVGPYLYFLAKYTPDSQSNSSTMFHSLYFLTESETSDAKFSRAFGSDASMAHDGVIARSANKNDGIYRMLKIGNTIYGASMVEDRLSCFFFLTGNVREVNEFDCGNMPLVSDGSRGFASTSLGIVEVGADGKTSMFYSKATGARTMAILGDRLVFDSWVNGTTDFSVREIKSLSIDTRGNLRTHISASAGLKGFFSDFIPTSNSVLMRGYYDNQRLDMKFKADYLRPVEIHLFEVALSSDEIKGEK